MCKEVGAGGWFDIFLVSASASICEGKNRRVNFMRLSIYASLCSAARGDSRNILLQLDISSKEVQKLCPSA